MVIFYSAYFLYGEIKKIINKIYKLWIEHPLLCHLCPNFPGVIQPVTGFCSHLSMAEYFAEESRYSNGQIWQGVKWKVLKTVIKVILHYIRTYIKCLSPLDAEVAGSSGTVSVSNMAKDKAKQLPSFWVPNLAPKAKPTLLKKPVSYHCEVIISEHCSNIVSLVLTFQSLVLLYVDAGYWFYFMSMLATILLNCPFLCCCLIILPGFSICS